MEELGISPPGSGLRVTVAKSQSLPSSSFRLNANGKILAVPTTLVLLSVQYQDPLASPVTYAEGTVKWANTIKRARKSLKSVTTQWVVFTGLKKHGFPGDAAVFSLPVVTEPSVAGMVAEKIPFTTEISRPMPESMVWWGPKDQPGTLTAAAARAATFPELRDRVARLRGQCAGIGVLHQESPSQNDLRLREFLQLVNSDQRARTRSQGCSVKE